MAVHPDPLSLGFSRQEHWSGLPFPPPRHESEKWKWSRSVVSDSSRPHGLQPTRLLRPWDFPGKSTGVGCHCLLRLCHLWHCFTHGLVAQSSLTLCNPMDYSPPGFSLRRISQARILEHIAIPFYRGSTWSRNKTWISCIEGGFFTVWATRELIWHFKSGPVPCQDITY